MIPTPKRPNIVLILADDLGFGDVRANNPSSRIPTPHLDALAREGMRFTDAHTSSAMCTPTRYGVLTGRYAWRTHLQKRVLPPFADPLIEPGRMTIASLLKSAGYRTAAIGKWHLGLGWQPKDRQSFDPGSWDVRQIDAVDFARPITAGPTDLGFDYFFGLNASNNMIPYCFIENDHVVGELVSRKSPVFDTEDGYGLVATGWRSEDIDQVLLARACSWMDRHVSTTPGEPFFLYLPTSAIHRPCLPSTGWTGRSGAGLRGDKVAELDGVVGTVVSELRRHGILDDTLLVFTSDNGALPGDVIPEVEKLATHAYGAQWNASDLLARSSEGIYESRHGGLLRWLTYNHRANGRFTGYKTDIYDGGHRVPFIVRWPGCVAPGRVSNRLICLNDFLATFADLLDTPLPDGAGEDSSSIMPSLIDDSISRDSVVHHSGEGMFAFRRDRWKLILGSNSGGFWTQRESDTVGQLYDMSADPEEQMNLYGSHPEVVSDLEACLSRCRGDGHSHRASVSSRR